MTRYRVGNRQKRNIYRMTPELPEGIYIGVMFTDLDAALVVEALNSLKDPPLMAAGNWCAPGRAPVDD